MKSVKCIKTGNHLQTVIISTFYPRRESKAMAESKTICLVICCGIIVSMGHIAEGIVTEDKIIDPGDIIPSLTTAAPPAFLKTWDSWKTWVAPAKIAKLAPYFKSGYDQDGLPVIIVQYGTWKYREIAGLHKNDVENFERYYEQFLRRLESEGAANNDAGIILILDWDGFSLANYASSSALKLALEVFTSLTRMNDVLQHAFDINKNYASETFTEISRPFLGNILEKFEFHGTRSEKWKPALLRKIPFNQLPPQYGGAKDWKPAPWI